MRGKANSRTHDELLRALDFKERFADSRIESDLIGLVRRLPNGNLERYSTKLAKESHMQWRFFAGSSGVAAGVKFQQGFSDSP